MGKRARVQRQAAERAAVEPGPPTCNTGVVPPPAGFWDDWPGAGALPFVDAAEALDRLRGVVSERDRLGVAQETMVRHARSKGATWTQIGAALGVSPQAVQKRYGATS